MTTRLPIHWIALSLIIASVLTPWPSHAQPQGDVFSSQGQYDRFAVGAAHRWYDKHSTEAKEKSGHCFSLLDEAKVYQDKALTLYEEAKRPGNSRQQSALVKQANEQIRLRGEKLRAFIDCVNQATRQTGPLSDHYASTGDAPPQDQVQTKPDPQPPLPGQGDGEKGIKRIPGPTRRPDNGVSRSPLVKAVDDCLKKSVPYYRSPDWSRLDPTLLRPKRIGQFEQSFVVSDAAAAQALQLDEAVYGKWNDRELMGDYLIGWLTHCLTQRNVIPPDDPRPSFDQFLLKQTGSPSKSQARRLERNDQFFHGYQSYPLPPFWDHEVAGPTAPFQ